MYHVRSFNKIYGVRFSNFGFGAYPTWAFFITYETAHKIFPQARIYRIPVHKLPKPVYVNGLGWTGNLWSEKQKGGVK